MSDWEAMKGAKLDHFSSLTGVKIKDTTEARIDPKKPNPPTQMPMQTRELIFDD